MAFIVGEASFSSSSTAANTTPPRSWTYHVFLNFRGEDTRRGFTDHLCASLERKGITTFKDDKDLERGEVISIELMKAIEESKFAITVLSPNYASSVWCLDELQHIVECSKNIGIEVVPVFYGVEPSDVRHQKGSFEKALRKLEERYGQDHEKVKRWRYSLTQVASYYAWDSKNQNEATLVESIAEHIHKRLVPKLPSCTENLVGVSSRVEEVTRFIGMGLNDVCFVGIWGMGGIGKTTIARALYEAIQCEFKSSCFLSNIREACETSKDLVQIQKELVVIMNVSTSTFNNEYDGRKIIQNSLCNKKVLLVLDDVSEVSQLENLAGKQNWFGSGSRIIITTRDIHLLKLHEVYGTYEVKCLVQNEALHLFCLKAFKQDEPKEGCLEMSNEVVEYTGGLPLALEVLGSYLHGRTVGVWRSAVQKIKSFPHSKILDTLKISYEGLDSMEKNVFLDIACFFKGMNKDYVIHVLEKCGYNPQIEVDVLIERSLVTISRDGRMDMHDLLQEMGRNIVIQESPNDPNKRSRLWSKNDIDLVLTKDKGTETIQGIVLSLGYDEHNKARCWSAEAFSSISQLKLLKMSGTRLPLGLNCLPSSLKVLHWNECPLKTLPLANQLNEVIEIKLRQSNIGQLWHGKKFLEKLKYLDLSSSWKLRQIPDLSEVPILETLILECCFGLVDVHPSLVHHKNLILLNLRSCRNLRTLPGKLEMSSLKELILDDCTSFENLPEFGKCMKRLSRISLRQTAITRLPTSLGCLVGLSVLNLTCCERLSFLPNRIHGSKSLGISNVSEFPNLTRLPREDLCAIEFKLQPFILPFLSSLDISYCCLPEESFPSDFFYFPSLMELNISYNDFRSIPITIHKLPKFKSLRINSCRKLWSLPDLPSSIRELEAFNCAMLKTSELNNLSKMSSIFASISQSHGRVMQMLISRIEIPPWFVHQQKGNRVSVPLPHNCQLNGRLGIALCFLFQIHGSYGYTSCERSLGVLCNGKSCINKRILARGKRGYHLYIIFLNNEFFGDEFHQDNIFELMIDNVPNGGFRVLCSAARWVHNHDVEGFEGKK